VTVTADNQKVAQRQATGKKDGRKRLNAAPRHRVRTHRGDEKPWTPQLPRLRPAPEVSASSLLVRNMQILGLVLVRYIVAFGEFNKVRRPLKQDLVVSVAESLLRAP